MYVDYIYIYINTYSAEIIPFIHFLNTQYVKEMGKVRRHGGSVLFAIDTLLLLSRDVRAGSNIEDVCLLGDVCERHKAKKLVSALM